MPKSVIASFSGNRLILISGNASLVFSYSNLANGSSKNNGYPKKENYYFFILVKLAVLLSKPEPFIL
jgi:hypothetical protein